MGKRNRLIRKLAWFEREIIDPYNKKHFARFEAFVPQPDKDNPLPCILVSVRNGHQKLFFRVGSVKELLQAFKIPVGARKRLTEALVEANRETDQIEQDYKLLFARRHHPDSQLIDTKTGEIIADVHAKYDAVAEAEKIARDHSR